MTVAEWNVSFPSRWETRRLKYLAPVSNERVGAVSEDDFYIGLEGIEVGTGNLVSRTNEEDEDSNTSEEGESFSTANIFHTGDVLFGKLRPYLAKVFLAGRSGHCSTEILVLKPSADVLSGFLKYTLLSTDFIRMVDSSTFGARMPRASWDFIGNITVPVPPLPTQRRIADFLDHETAQIDALIEAKEQMLALLKEKRAVQISHMVMKGLDPNIKMQDSGLEWLGEIPKHWTVQRLKNFLYGIEQGWSPQCDNFPALPDSWGVLKVGAVNGWEFNPDENKSLPEELQPLEEYEIKPGDVLMSRANTTKLVGQAVIVKSVRAKLLLCDKLYRLKIDNKRLESEYLISFMSTKEGRFEFERDASGASNSMQNIGQDSVANLWVPIPPPDEQSLIVYQIQQEVYKSNSMDLELKRSLALLRKRRSALITAAITGQLQEVLE